MEQDKALLKGMCSALGAGDIKAICRSRGFPSPAETSRDILESVFLSDVGAASIFDSLTQAEIIVLHLLKFKGEAVKVSVFERIYGKAGKRDYYQSFTERYRHVFHQVKSSLVRKGVLLMAECESDWSARTKMERWRFKLPQEFERFLPSPFASTKTARWPGNFRSEVLRDKIMEIVNSKGGDTEKHDLTISNGELRIGDRPFQTKHLQQWQRTCWESSVGAGRKSKGKEPSPVESLAYALSRLKPDEWALPGDATPLLGIFRYGAKVPAAELICEAGWKWGCLLRHMADGKTYYRLAEGRSAAPDAARVDPGSFLTVHEKVSGRLPTASGGGTSSRERSVGGGTPSQKDSVVEIGLQRVPVECLEPLARLSTMKVANSSVFASPNLIKIGNAPETTRTHHVTHWLRKNSSAFRQAMETADKRRGKTIIHENLLLAKVTDLSLKVKIQRAFSNPRKMAVLPNDFIAFPCGLLPEIRKLVMKSGHVIRVVEEDE